MLAAAKKKPERDLVDLYADIQRLQEEISAYFDSRAAEVQKGTGLPFPVVRQDLIKRFLCPCQAALVIIDEDIKGKALNG